MIVDIALKAVELFIDALKKAWKAFKRLRREIMKAIDACTSYRLSLTGFGKKYAGVRFLDEFQEKIDIFKAKMDGSKKICDKLSAKSAVKRFLLAGFTYLPELKHAVDNIHEYWERYLKEYIDNPRPMMADQETEEEKAVKWAAMEKAKYEAELVKARTQAEAELQNARRLHELAESKRKADVAAELLEAKKKLDQEEAKKRAEVTAAKLQEEKYTAEARAAEAAKKARQAAAETAAEDARIEAARLKREADLAAARKAALDAKNASLTVAADNQAKANQLKQADHDAIVRALKFKLSAAESQAHQEKVKRERAERELVEQARRGDVKLRECRQNYTDMKHLCERAVASSENVVQERDQLARELALAKASVTRPRVQLRSRPNGPAR